MTDDHAHHKWVHEGTHSTACARTLSETPIPREAP